jgi:hypothetical protein
MTCSLDRTVVLFDVHACPPSGKQVVRMSLGGPLESVACRPAGDLAFAGSSGGTIYVVDLSAAAAGISAAASADANAGGAARVLEGHTRAVTALACSLDNVTLVSASEDGSLRVWDMVTRQCLREVQPLNKTALTNCIVRPCAVDHFALFFDPCCVSHKKVTLRPELVGIGAAVHKPSLCPLSSLRKYAAGSTNGGVSATDGNGGGGGGGGGNERAPLVLAPRLVGVAPAAQPYYPTGRDGQGPDAVFGGAGGGHEEKKVEHQQQHRSKQPAAPDDGRRRRGPSQGLGSDDFVVLPPASDDNNNDDDDDDNNDDDAKARGIGAARPALKKQQREPKGESDAGGGDEAKGKKQKKCKK